MDEVGFDRREWPVFDHDHVMIFLHGIDDVMEERFLGRLGRGAILTRRIRCVRTITLGDCKKVKTGGVRVRGGSSFTHVALSAVDGIAVFPRLESSA